MTKYIQEQIAELKGRRNGITKNSDKWANLPVKIEEIDARIKELEEIDAKIADGLNTVQQLRDKARSLVGGNWKEIAKIDSFAMGIHSESQEKLNEYGLGAQSDKYNTAARTLPIPAKVVIDSIIDDYDGVGFIVQLSRIDNVEHFEVERGRVEDPKTSILAPPYPFLRTVKKLKFTDDDIVKGQRYFYRVRAVNRNGAGEWSEPLSRVQ